jgi:hypothetical protein
LAGEGAEGAVDALLYAWVLADAAGHCGILLYFAEEKGSPNVVVFAQYRCERLENA